MLLDTPKIDPAAELGEDTWDLFELIEKSFGVTFDYAMLLGSSVRDIAELIAQQATKTRPENCLTAAMYYLLRREFISELAVPKTSIRPDASLTSLLPWGRRTVCLLMLEKRLKLKLPTLRMPTWLFVSILFLSGATGFLFWEVAWQNFLGAGVFTVSAFIVLLRVALPLGRAFPSGCVTFGDFVRLALAQNYVELSARFGGASPALIIALLIQLIAAETGIDPDEITAETRVPQGLNIY